MKPTGGRKTSVLNKMPRDCTAPHFRVCNDVQSYRGGRIQYTPHSNCLFKYTFIIPPSTFTMTKKRNTNAAKAINKKKNAVKTVVVRAPTSISARQGIPNSGSRQEIMLKEVKAGSTSHILHCGNMPWLKGVAPSYQKWNLKNVRVWFEPRMSTATNGTVQMCFLKDFEDLIPTSVDQISSVHGASRAAVWDKQSLTIPERGAMDYCSLSNFQSMVSTDQNARALGRIAVVADMDSTFSKDTVVGRIYMSYTPVLTGPTDPTLQ